MIEKESEKRMIDGRFRIARLLRGCDLGSVHQGLDTTLGQKVTVEIFNSELAEDSGVIRSFDREALMGAKITHQSAIEVIDIGFSELNEPYLVVEPIRGESLSMMVKRTGPLDLESASAIMESTLSFLNAAHSKGIVHLDLKPDHIFVVNKLGAEPLIKVSYLDIAKLIRGAEKQIPILVNFYLSDLSYRSPEQFRDLASVDFRSELYSMGVVLYEMLCGSRPFEADDSLAILHKHVYETPQPLPERRAGLTQQTYRLVDICLQKDPNQRYQTAREFVAAIERALEAEQPTHDAPLGWQGPAADATIVSPILLEPPPPERRSMPV